MMKVEDIDFSKSYTYADYLKWELDERLELIKGQIFRMSPAPNVRHQRISGHIFREISWFLKKQPCQVFAAPFDVRLSRKGKKDNLIDTVVQPDICVICDPSKLDERGCMGAPDIVVEILSPGNTSKEMRNKFQLYEENGVPEYWVVIPSVELLYIYRLNSKGKYVADNPYVPGDEVTTPVLPGFVLSLNDIFM